jgi:hypothetical protein
MQAEAAATEGPDTERPKAVTAETMEITEQKSKRARKAGTERPRPRSLKAKEWQIIRRLQIRKKKLSLNPKVSVQEAAHPEDEVWRRRTEKKAEAV